MSIDYAAACDTATAAQGLDHLTAALDARGITYDVEQTGGFCMVVTVSGRSGVLAVIYDADPESTDPTTEPAWLTGFYPGAAWQESGESESDTAATLTETVARLTAHAAAC